MIDFKMQEMGLNDKRLKIKEWRVLFQTPFGLCETPTQAIAKCQESDLEPNDCVLPVAVAFSEEGQYEISAR